MRGVSTTTNGARRTTRTTAIASRGTLKVIRSPAASVSTNWLTYPRQAASARGILSTNFNLSAESNLSRCCTRTSLTQKCHGAHFCTRARGGLTQLSAWLVSLGIRLIRSRPGKPQDNGGGQSHRQSRGRAWRHQPLLPEVQREDVAVTGPEAVHVPKVAPHHRDAAPGPGADLWAVQKMLRHTDAGHDRALRAPRPRLSAGADHAAETDRFCFPLATGSRKQRMSD